MTTPTPLVFTGERFHSEARGNMWCEHWHRYHYVLPMTRGQKVLDVACGEGYGSALMSEGAAQVTGVDISADAIAHAKRTYAEKFNLDYIESTCVSLPFDNAEFDRVVSFETIEHIHEQEQFLDEIKRVLKPDGVLIISSPNKTEYSDKTGYQNEFHVKELYLDELENLIRPRFANTQWLSQRNAFVSMITPLQNGSNTAPDKAFTHLSGESITVSKQAPQRLTADLPALYFILLASNAALSTTTDTARISTFIDAEEWAENQFETDSLALHHTRQREQALIAECAALKRQLESAIHPIAAHPMPATNFLSRLKRFVAG